MGKWWFVLSLLGLLWAGLQPKMTFELEPRNLTFAYPVRMVVDNLPQDIEVVCFGYETLSTSFDYENQIDSWGACEGADNRPEVVREVKVTSGVYDFYVQTFDWRGNRRDYRVKRAEVK